VRREWAEAAGTAMCVTNAYTRCAWQDSARGRNIALHNQEHAHNLQGDDVFLHLLRTREKMHTAMVVLVHRP
jgi:hypothetical protein